MRLCQIIGAGPSDFVIRENAFIICADGGYERLEKINVKADLIIGDFDSSENLPSGNFKRFPVKKDDTDTLLALKEAISLGFDTVYVFGGMGGQLDHTIANLQSLVFARQSGVNAILCGYGQCAAVIDSRTALCFKDKKNGRLSVFAVCSEAAGVRVTGAEYRADGIDLSPSFPLGVSNSFVGDEVNISLSEGHLLVIWEGQPEDAEFL